MNADTTMAACFAGSASQAAVNNLAPLLFTVFQAEFGIPLASITLLITMNFSVQLCVDLASVWIVKRFGCRTAIVAANLLCGTGLILMAVLPGVMPSPLAGLMTAVLVYAVGGGLIEVLVSPIMEACPTKHKEQAMSLLHSFYCWGHVSVVLLSTIFLRIAGLEHWRTLAVLWALLPLANAFLFSRTPIYPLIPEGDTGLSLRELFAMPLFWGFLIMMMSSGASEQAVSQWASALAEKGLGVSKSLGDLAGPMSFALLMGLSRAWYGRYGGRVSLSRFMTASAVLCIASYLCIGLSPSAPAALIACGTCGLSVGIFWPGTCSRAAASIRRGGTAMFAMLALAGDLGCSVGPTLAGMVSSMQGGRLQSGILAAICFPVLVLACLLYRRKDAGSRV